MGRGRAKAKQTKVARDLKYNSQDPANKSRDDEDPFAEGNYIPRA